MKMRSNVLICLVALSVLAGCAVAAEAPAAPADFVEAVILHAIGFLPTDLKPKFAAMRNDLVFAAGLQSARPDSYFGYAAEDDTLARRAFAGDFAAVRNAVITGKTPADLKLELGRIARHVVMMCQPFRGDRVAFENPAQSAFEKDLDAKCSAFKANFDKFQRVEDANRFVRETAANARGEGKKLAAGGADADRVPAAVFALASNSLSDVWSSLFAKPAAEADGDFVGNKSSKRFHKATCRHLPSEKNRVTFKTREEAIGDGYEPCKVCKP